MAVININPEYDYKKQPMFFGEDLGVSRFEDPNHPKLEALIEKHLAQYWRPEEFNLMLDSAQFNKLSANDQKIFTNNLKYQIIMDRVQSDAPAEALSAICSDVVLQAWIQTWTFYETIHARSYTHIIRNLYPNPSIIFDEITLDPNLMKRAKSITEKYDRLIKLAAEYTVMRADEVQPSVEFMHEIRKELYLTLHTINALEAIRFYASFITTFNFLENMGVMEGNVKIMQSIARDENLHHQSTRYMIERIQSGSEGEEWLPIVEECRDAASEVFKNVIREEKEWVVINFKDGAPKGLNVQIMHDFLDWSGVPQMKKLNLDTEGMTAPTKHPIPWLNKFLISSNVQAAPQEGELTSYLIAQLHMDVTSEVIASFKDKYYDMF